MPLDVAAWTRAKRFEMDARRRRLLELFWGFVAPALMVLGGGSQWLLWHGRLAQGLLAAAGFFLCALFLWGRLRAHWELQRDALRRLAELARADRESRERRERMH